MPVKTLTRREFFKISGIVISSAALIGTGLTVLDSNQNLAELPKYEFGENNMEKRILVTYASQSGFTAGVSEAIGKTISDGGAQVDVLPMKEINDLSVYSAVVAGSAILGQKWLPEAMKFLKEHQNELSRKPFASFMVCITLSMANAAQYRDGLKDWMAPIRNIVKPVSEGYFAGGLDFLKLPFTLNVLAMRLVVLFGLWKEGDHRDWHAIRTWADSLRPLVIK